MTVEPYNIIDEAGIVHRAVHHTSDGNPRYTTHCDEVACLEEMVHTWHPGGNFAGRFVPERHWPEPNAGTAAVTCLQCLGES